MTSYEYTAEAEADRLRAKLLLKEQLPRKGDEHLQVVLCECGGYQPYVVWYFNRECGGFSDGAYCKTLHEAVHAFEARCRRYGVPVEETPNE